MEIFFFTLGCKVNQYETVILKNIFLKQNFKISNKPEEAKIFIINSCTVTSASDRKINKLINKIKNIKKDAIIVLTGCFPQAFPFKETFFNKVDIVTGNSNKFKLVEILQNYLKNKEKVVLIKEHELKKPFENLTIKKVFKTPRAFIKIQDGCNQFCTYCIIPKARGYLKSKPIEKIMEECETVSKKGCLEIVLTGINLSLYGKDLKNFNLIDVVKNISKIESVKRIRLSSLEPNLFSKEDLLTLKEKEKFCPQFHFSLQSGSNLILEKMGRHYNKTNYLKTVEFINKTFKNPSITTDIIVGFPGETKEEFEKTLKFVEEVGFFKVHVFPYSKREGTKAAKMPFQIPKEEKKLRVKILQDIANKMNVKFLNKQINKTLETLFETKNNDEYVGYSKNYCPVKITSNENLIGKIKKVKITSLKENNLTGKILV